MTKDLKEILIPIIDNETVKYKPTALFDKTYVVELTTDIEEVLSTLTSDIQNDIKEEFAYLLYGELNCERVARQGIRYVSYNNLKELVHRRFNEKNNELEVELDNELIPQLEAFEMNIYNDITKIYYVFTLDITNGVTLKDVHLEKNYRPKTLYELDYDEYTQEEIEDDQLDMYSEASFRNNNDC